MNEKILIVEDEEKLARFVELELRHEGYETDKAFDGRSALDKALGQDYDLILLDIMLPGLNGLEVLRRLQILLTARDAVMDKVAGLDAGAVDYITKPFAIEELLARIRVALKLHHAVEDPARGAAEQKKEEGVLTWGPLRLDELRHRVTYGSHEINLTNREFVMLKTLLLNQDIVLSRETLLNTVCGYDYVRFLRSKIDDVFSVKMIHTVRGMGYVIKPWEDEPS